METWTITFCEAAENHAGMQIIGKHADNGFTTLELELMKLECEKRGYKTDLYNLDHKLPKILQTDDCKASVLIIKNGVEMLLGDKTKCIELTKEIDALKNIVDKKAFMYGRVVNKKARYNLCFGNENQEPDYENKKGRIIKFDSVPYLNIIRNNLSNIMGDKAKNLLAELNYYYDINKCFIGWHGDTERKLVIGMRIGAQFPLYFQWYHKNCKIGDNLKIDLDGSDIYVMSSKTVGTDWKKNNIPTLRHAAGFEQNIN
jgi:hypothetical protein